MYPWNESRTHDDYECPSASSNIYVFWNLKALLSWLGDILALFCVCGCCSCTYDQYLRCTVADTLWVGQWQPRFSRKTSRWSGAHVLDPVCGSMLSRWNLKGQEQQSRSNMKPITGESKLRPKGIVSDECCWFHGAKQRSQQQQEKEPEPQQEQGRGGGGRGQGRRRGRGRGRTRTGTTMTTTTTLPPPQLFLLFLILLLLILLPLILLMSVLLLLQLFLSYFFRVFLVVFLDACFSTPSPLPSPSPSSSSELYRIWAWFHVFILSLRGAFKSWLFLL